MSLQKIFQSKGGHSIWRDEYESGGRGGRLMIKDQSGETPDTTDDGILLIDSTRKPVVQDDGTVWLPLRKPDMEEVSTITSPEVYRYLRALWWRGNRAIQAIDCPYCGDAS